MAVSNYIDQLKEAAENEAHLADHLHLPSRLSILVEQDFTFPVTLADFVQIYATIVECIPAHTEAYEFAKRNLVGNFASSASVEDIVEFHSGIIQVSEYHDNETRLREWVSKGSPERARLLDFLRNEIYYLDERCLQDLWLTIDLRPDKTRVTDALRQLWDTPENKKDLEWNTLYNESMNRWLSD